MVKHPTGLLPCQFEVFQSSTKISDMKVPLSYQFWITNNGKTFMWSIVPLRHMLVLKWYLSYVLNKKTLAFLTLHLIIRTFHWTYLRLIKNTVSLVGPFCRPHYSFYFVWNLFKTALPFSKELHWNSLKGCVCTRSVVN